MWRADFPIFNDNNLVYLDNAATTQKPSIVITYTCGFCLRDYANVHRGIYPLSETATMQYERARETVAEYIGASSQKEIVFVRNTTEAINLIAYSFCEDNLKEGDRIMVTVADHHSNFVPWQQMAKKYGAEFVVAPVDEKGLIDIDFVQKELEKGIKLFAFPMISNVLGTLFPVKKLCEIAKRYNTVTVVDGAQAAGHMKVDVSDIGMDFFAFSGHKMYGPTGVGVLYGRYEMLSNMRPFLFGGEMIRVVKVDHTTFSDVPYRFEAGTPSIAEAVGLGQTISYIKGVGIERIKKYEDELVAYVYNALKDFDGINIYGPGLDNRMSLVAFNLEGVHPHDVAGVLGSENICIRAGHHCAQPLHNHLGIKASCRVSVGMYNTKEDIDRFLDALEKVKKIFRV